MKYLQGLSFSVFLLSLCQGLGLTTAVISVTVSAIAGMTIADSSFLSTLPYGMQFVGVILASLPSSVLMEKFGRKIIFLGGSAFGAVSGVIGYQALEENSILLLCLSHLLLGIFLANVNLFRFASLDLTPKEAQSKALSLVLFGGVFASILGPLLSRNSEMLLPSIDNPISAVYLVISGVAILVMLVLSSLSLPPPSSAKRPEETNLGELLQNRSFVYAILCGGIGYGLMNMLMISSSLVMKDLHFDHHAITWVIQWHVFAMFFPSLFSGFLIRTLGVERFLKLGMVLQLASSCAAIYGETEVMFYVTLVLLGLAWNFMYIGASYLVSTVFTDYRKFKAQGSNDMFVAVVSTGGALFAGSLLGVLGWFGLNILSIMITFGLLMVGLVSSQPERQAIKQA